MKQIRRNVFETNSSSTHAFAYHKESKPEVDFDNYEATIEPYYVDEFNYPIHTFDDINGKLRYFYTLYCRYANPHQDEFKGQIECKNFMEIIFELFPKVKFAEAPTDPHTTLYMEDADYIFDTFMCGNDELWMQITNKEQMKKFFQNGVIYFGDRDAGNPYSYFDPWDDVWDYNGDIIKITKVSG